VIDVVLDASLTLQWFLEDERDREYSLRILRSLSDRRAIVPMLWFYEVGNGLLMAYRRKRISFKQIDEFLMRLGKLPADAVQQSASEAFGLPEIARNYGLTNYDAAYLALAQQLKVPLAITDSALRKAAASASIVIA
jgi:predicted nucleic acid-binding protein